MEIEKEGITLLQISNVCMLVVWDIMNIFLHGADIEFPTEIELKILDQIHHLKLY
jgi:hypothetical protein